MDQHSKESGANYQAEVIKKHRAGKRKRAKRQVERLFYLCLFLALFAHLTNPFTWLSVVQDPFDVTNGAQNQLILTTVTPIYVSQNPVYRSIAELKSGWHIFINRFRGGPKTRATHAEQIIKEIHRKRFNPNYPYLISGDHFSVLYPRSLGIFYNALLDPRTALDETDWFNRQALYLKTTAYTLSVFEKTTRLSTTIVPIGPNGVTILNIFSPPSDTLYSLLYALTVLRDSDFIKQLYPFEREEGAYPLRTTEAAGRLLLEHEKSLTLYIKEYADTVLDPDTGLILSSAVLSGTKDSVIRHEAFYDNVIFWATQKLAMKLNLIPENEKYLADLKSRILSKYWDTSLGYFREDFSSWNISQNENYSSDWLIALMTGFLSPNNPDDLPYITKSVAYIAERGINKPFALRYQSDQHERLHPVVRMFAPSYGTTAIWSNWGMEYSKLLLQLYETTCSEQYLSEAEMNVNRYRENIEKYRGYPEVYTDSGNLFTETLYTSVRGTGWVVNFEQAEAMLEWTEKKVVKRCTESAT